MAKTQKAAKPKGRAITGDETPAERAIVKAQKPGSPAVNPETLIIEAVRKGDIALVERVLAVRRELKAEWAREQYYIALAAFQADCPTIQKTKAVHERNSEKVRYKYAPLESIVEQVKIPLRDHGFSYRVETNQDTAGYVIGTLYACHRDGHQETTTVRIPINADSYMAAEQKVGSAITYAKRYAFCDAFGILTGDEDNDANNPTQGKTEAPAAPRTSQREAPRDVTPPPAGQTEPMEPAGRKLPAQLAGIKKVGEEAYWLLVDALKAKLVTHAYCETQGVRLSKNRGNDQFLADMKVEIEAAIDKARKEVA